MKKTILLSSIFAVGAALATDVDSTVIGTLPVEVAKGQQLMAVPFADNANGEIAVNDMVRTSDLETGTKLYVATSSGYDMWTLGDDGKWKAAKKVTIGNDGNAIADESKDATEATVKRGDAFWLETVEGQSGGNVTLLGGKSNAATQVVPGKWNLIGNRGLVEVTVGVDSITGAATGDQIVVSKNGSLSYWTFKTGKGWRLPDGKGGWQSVALTLKAGQGCWLKTKNSVTVNF